MKEEEEEKKINDDTILQSHFENKILKTQQYETKYGDRAQKEQKYFIASFYRDANITDDKDFKERFIKTPCAMKSCPNTRTTFATLFSKNDSGIYPEKIFEYLNPAYTYCGFIYKDFNTAFWSKADNNNQQILAECKGNEEKIKELCENGVTRKNIYTKRKEKRKLAPDDDESHYAYGESIRPGKDASKNYLQRMDFLRHRIEQDVEMDDCSTLKHINSRVNTKPCNFNGKEESNVRYKKIKSDAKELTLGVMGNARYTSGFGMRSYYNNNIVFNKETKQIDEKTACNEFVSLNNEEVSSLMLYIKNLNSNKSLDKEVMNTMLENYATEYKHDKYTEEVANVVSNIKKMLFAQKNLGIPYMPIFGGDGKVLCVKLSVILQAIMDTELYKNKKKNDKPTITNEEITKLQKFEEEKILELEKQANKQNDIEAKEPPKENIIEKKPSTSQLNENVPENNTGQNNSIETKEQQKGDIIEEKASTSRLNEENMPKNNTRQNNSFHDTLQQWWQKVYSCSCCDDTNNNESSTQINILNNANKKNININ